MGFDLAVVGLGVPTNSSNAANNNGSSGDSMLAYQANFHQAFLQSAMAQNIQIQQQILAQNQALHQLLQQQQLLPPAAATAVSTCLLLLLLMFPVADITQTVCSCNSVV